MIFPADLAGFARVGLARFSSGGGDVSAAYVNPGVAAATEITISLRRAAEPPTVGLSAEAVAAARDQACRAAFVDRLGALGAIHRAEPINQGTLDVRRNGILHSGRRAEFLYQTLFDGRRQRVRTRIERFCLAEPGWSIEFVSTWPDGSDGAGPVTAFEGALPWTGALSGR